MASTRFLASQSVRRSLLQPRASLFVTPRATTVRGISGSNARQAAKEDALHEEGRDQEVEYHKEDLLKKQKEGKGHWKDELASNSESIVKAERGEIEASEETIKKLQKDSEELLKKKGE